MSIIKSLSVGNGDMFYIQHNTDSFTVIDCCMDEENQERIVKEIQQKSQGKGVKRFISTHPDEDHLRGIRYLNENWEIVNFYCVRNQAIKKEETKDFKYYCELRKEAYCIEKGCQRKWLNCEDNERGSAGIEFLWPDINNSAYQEALERVKNGQGFNNISPIFIYMGENVKAMWMGDMEQIFLEKIKAQIEWPKIDILFAPHHGRKSGRVSPDVLQKLKPQVIVVGEAPSEDLDYYSNYNTITQNSAGDITFVCENNRVYVYVSKSSYHWDKIFLNHDLPGEEKYGKYLGYFIPEGVR